MFRMHSIGYIVIHFIKKKAWSALLCICSISKSIVIVNHPIFRVCLLFSIVFCFYFWKNFPKSNFCLSDGFTIHLIKTMVDDIIKYGNMFLFYIFRKCPFFQSSASHSSASHPLSLLQNSTKIEATGHRYNWNCVNRRIYRRKWNIRNTIIKIEYRKLIHSWLLFRGKINKFFFFE